MHELEKDLAFLPERIKIGKVKNLLDNLYDKNEFVLHAHIRNLNQALNHELVLKKIHRIIKFNENACLKPYIDMNPHLRKKAKNDFEKDLFYVDK